MVRISTPNSNVQSTIEIASSAILRRTLREKFLMVTDYNYSRLKIFAVQSVARKPLRVPTTVSFWIIGMAVAHLA